MQKTLNKLKADKEDVDYLIESQEQLKELFMLVIVGEFNSGKSSFINALLGEKYLEQGVTPTTTKINVIKYGEKESNQLNKDILTTHLPIPWLEDINV